MYNLKSRLVFVFITLLTLQLNGQHFLSTSGKSIVNENQEPILLRGMGLGGWMVQEGYMLQTAGFANPQHKIRSTIEGLIGKDDTDLFYEAWLANHVRKADIDSLKSWGFNSVRLPMHYNLFTLPIEDEPVEGQDTWLTKGFELTDSLISWCAANEMYVILDMHATPGGQGYDEAISDYDPTKPSLWESDENKRKLVALWTRIAERYADEQWVAGYDLINEPNWNLPGGNALRTIYQQLTQSIRTVDPKHIIFIEGNWFANDFTGLTPPWDDNFVYSPHKYWSTNDEATMQWVIDLRNTYNVPLYLGESGENSNVWFRDAIRLLEDLDIGWAWWPMKKVESIAGPLSVVKSAEYQSLLDYWSGNGYTPTAEFGKAALMDLTEKLKIENCIYQKDVIDAMFRQVYSDETLPFNTNTIPGIINATDYDLGAIGQAYHDIQSANYQVSTGDFTAWNNGWQYRNDGVDIEKSSNIVNSNGYNVGFMDAGEWMQYKVDIEESGIYDIHVRGASGGSGGLFHFSIDGSDITPRSFIGPTGDWQNWQTTTIENVILDVNDKKLRFYTDAAGFNIGSFEFVKTGDSTTTVSTLFVSAETVDEKTIQISVNKFMGSDLPTTPADFKVIINGTNIPIIDMFVSADNPRIINFALDQIMNSSQNIKISYAGDNVIADDGTPLMQFKFEDVKNTLNFVHQLPGKIEAEDFEMQSGVELETTTDTGGGQNIGFLDVNDYLDYDINIVKVGNYKVDYRTAAQFGTGGIQLQLIDEAGTMSVVDSPTFTSTGGWQSWNTTSSMISLPEGRYTMRILITQSPFNMNWIDFDLVTSTQDLNSSLVNSLNIYPNPSNGIFKVEAELKNDQNVQLEVYNLNGQLLQSKSVNNVSLLREVVTLESVVDGVYILKLRLENGREVVRNLIKG